MRCVEHNRTVIVYMSALFWMQSTNTLRGLNLLVFHLAGRLGQNSVVSTELCTIQLASLGPCDSEKMCGFVPLPNSQVSTKLTSMVGELDIFLLGFTFNPNSAKSAGKSDRQ